MAITRLDVLDTLPHTMICVGYKMDGQTINYFPSNVTVLEKCQPIYEQLQGWKSSTSDIREFKNLPMEAKPGDYALFLRKASVEIKYKHESYLIVPQGAILVLVRDEQELPRNEPSTDLDEDITF